MESESDEMSIGSYILIEWENCFIVIFLVLNICKIMCMIDYGYTYGYS